MMRTPRRIAGLLATLPLAALLTAAGSSQALADPAYQELCAGPVAELQAIQARIREHNARPHTGPYSAAAAAYDSEAATLRSEQNRALSRLMACERSLDQMQARYPKSTIMSPSADDVTKIGTALKKVTDAEKQAATRWNAKTYDYLKYGQGKAGMTKRVDRRPAKLPPSVYSVYKALDQTRPTFPKTAYLQGVQAPKTGTPDPAYPPSSGRVVNSTHMDHIVPLRRLVSMRDFLKLTPGNMYIVANSPANGQWLSGSANLSKGSGSAALTSGTSPAWRQRQAQLRQKAESELQELIDALLKSQRS
ncbi:hypothetical protein amrb99_06160 [Actinomadura sp. RB99]|nr:hypothetical protein [Actinomadura sp. RB99]